MLSWGWLAPRFAADKASGLLDHDAILLDAGAGSGMTGQALWAVGFRVIDGIDLSAAQLKEARVKGVYRELVHGRLGDVLDFPSSTYDGVVAVGTFTFGHAPASSFDELVRIVKSGGYLLFTLPVEGDPQGYREKFVELTDTHLWSLVEWGEPFYSLPHGEPEMQHRIVVFRVC